MRATISVATCVRNQGSAVPWTKIHYDDKTPSRRCYPARYPWCHQCPDGERAAVGHLEDTDMSEILAQAEAKVEQENQTKKMCPRCGETKPIYAFSKNARKPDGLQHNCKACQRDLQQQSRSKAIAIIRSAREAAAKAEVGRVCTKCGQTKPLAEFSAHTESKNGRRHQCRDCVREYQRAWRLDQTKTDKKEEAVNVFDLPAVVTEEPTVAEQPEIQAPATEPVNEVPKSLPAPAQERPYERYLWIDLQRFPEVLSWLTELADQEDCTTEAQVRHMLRQQHRAHVACNGGE